LFPPPHPFFLPPVEMVGSSMRKLAGYLSQMAFHQLMIRVEKALDQQEIALGVFLNIEGAFNNTPYDSMCATLVRHGVDHTIV